VAQACPTHAVVVVEFLVLPSSVNADLGGKPTVAADAGADAREAGRWGEDDTPSGTLEGHYWMELSQPFSYCSPYGRGSHHP
jgi:hypothetical protein